MASVFDVTAADISKAQLFPASLVKAELRENGGTSDQWVTYGDIGSGEINAEGKFQAVSAGAERQIGMMVTVTFNLFATGANVRAAIDAVKEYITDLRVTDINGHVYTFAAESTGIKGDLVIGEMVTGSDNVDGAKYFSCRWKGFVTMAKWNSYFAAA